MLRPNARIINICDMPIAIIDVVCAALDIDKKDVEYDYFGLNHFGWFTSIRHKGEEVLPQLREYIKEHEILLPDSYLKGMGSLMAKKPEEAVDEHPEQEPPHQGQLVLRLEGRVRDHGVLPGVPAQHVSELLPAAEGVRRALQPRAHPC